MNVRTNPYLADALHDQREAAAIRSTRSAGSLPCPERSAGSAVRGRRILITDCNLSSAQTLAALLQAQGHETCIAQDGLEALHALDSYAPDAVFINVALPYMDGYETCLLLRKRRGGRRLLIIALTGWTLPALPQRGALARFDDVIAQPYDAEQLQALLAAPK